MNPFTDKNNPEFKSLPQKYQIQLELKDHLISKLQNQLNDLTEDLLQTKAMLDLVKDQFLSLLKKIIQDKKKFPSTIYRTQLINDYISNLAKLKTNENSQISPKSVKNENLKSNGNFNFMNNSYSSYLDNTQKSFAFSSRYNVLMDEHLNNLYKRGKYQDNCLWLTYNNDFNNLKKNNNCKNSFYISSSPSKSIYKRKHFDLESSFSSRKSLDHSELRNLSEKRNKQKGKVSAAYESFSNRSFSLKPHSYIGNLNNSYGYQVNRKRFDTNNNEQNNIHVNMKNQGGNNKITKYSSSGY